MREESDFNIINKYHKNKSCNINKNIINIGFSCINQTIKKCCTSQQNKSKLFYINKWRKYLLRESQTSKELNDPFDLLTHLYAHKIVLQELENIRLNPNLLSKTNIRNDLEFYIPQLCSFILFGDYEAVQELFSFLCKSCHASFSFAHRIVWFLKSSINDDSDANEKIKVMLHIIQTIFKSDRQKDELESLYLSGSSDYINYLNSKHLLNIYCKNLEINDYNPHSKNDIFNDFVKRKTKFRIQLNKINENKYLYELEKLKIKEDKKNNISEVKIEDFYESYSKQHDNREDIKIDLKEIYLNIFQNYNLLNENDDELISTTNNLNYIKQIDSDDVNLSSFLSNINFVDNLCNICDILLTTPNEERLKTLLTEINKINKILPSNVYMPFLYSSMRNYTIASIPLSEIKIFKTKERCPYKISLECFRLDELNYYLLNNINPLSLLNERESNNSNHSDSENNSNSNANTVNFNSDYLKVIDTDGEIKKNEGKNSSFLNISYLKNKTDFSNISPKKNKFFNISHKKLSEKKTLKSNEDSSNKTQSEKLNNYLNENNKKFSEAIIINNIKKKNEPEIQKKTKSSSHIYRVNHQKYNRLKDTEFSQNEVNLGNMNPYSNLLNKLTKYDLIDNEVKSNFLTSRKDEIISLDKSEDDIKIKVISERVKDSTTNNKQQLNKTSDNVINTSKAYQSQSDISGSDDSKSEEEKDDDDGNNSNNNLENNDILQSEYHKLFGEKIEETTERLRKLSPFGMLKTYKIFNVIIKSGEDLRQEQFAIQLINEFSQIFKLEGVKCWVKPYEIIATGPNVGIVEVVNNSLSIDQLKRKTKISLNEFFINYFGPANTSGYKIAMKNYISSLAGYSLVCYFLQIKDRHNANILIDDQGHLIHIDFGFMLSNAPGKGLKFEKAPFKLTKELVDVMGGTKTKYFNTFRKTLWKGFVALVEHYEKILILVEMMFCGHGNKLPCFEAGQKTIVDLKQRFIPKKGMKKRDYIAHVDYLIGQSLDNWRTNWYDKFQYFFQGILP